MLATVARHVIRVVPDGVAIAIIRALATRTRTAPVSDSENKAMAQATRVAHGDMTAWTWGKGPLVIFIHGWACRASQMAPLALHVASLGFRSVVFDVTGHGESRLRRTQWAYFLRDIAAVSKLFDEDVYAYVGHSAGGLSMMAARGLKGIRAQRYVCVCAPSYPYPFIEGIQKRLQARQSVIDRYQELIAGQFETTWAKLQAGVSFAGASKDLLLVYDDADRLVSDSDGDKLHTLCPESRLVKTRGYGHMRILRSHELHTAVGDFLTGHPSPSIMPQHSFADS